MLLPSAFYVLLRYKKGKLTIKRDYNVENIGLWFDYLDLLSYFGLLCIFK